MAYNWRIVNMKKIFFYVLLSLSILCLPIALNASMPYFNGFENGCRSNDGIHTITATAGENGSIDPSGNVEVTDGEDQVFTITPSAGYRVESVIVDASDVTENITTGDGVFYYTFENVTDDHTINVTFEEIPTFTITVEVGENGTVLYNDAAVSDYVTVSEGDTPEFIITPATSYQIAVVSLDGNAIDLTTSQLGGFTYTFEPVMATHTLAVTFEAIPATTYTITGTVIGGHGTMTPDGSVVVNAGDTYEVVFSPEENYALDTVKDNGFIKFPVEGTGYIFDNVYTLTNVSEDHEIIVKYKDTRPYYNIHVEVETAGGDATPRDTTVVAGSDVTINVTPSEGYHISRLEIDSNMLNNCETDEISFRNVQADHNIKIAFYPNSIEENTISSLNVYPNPNNGMFSIDLSNIEGEATYQLIDARGAVVETREINVANGETKMFNHKLNAGTYFVRIINGDKVYVEQIVVE